ncbi:MAG: 3-oxoadipate enol-lactonase [Pseudomonadota bacterium]
MQFAEVNGATLRYREAGDRNGPAVIFANSLGTDLTIWDEVVARLPAGYRCIGFDKRGHGLSSMPMGAMSIALYAADLLALADRLGVRSFVVCGVSIGGMIAQSAATQAPDRVRALVLCNTGAQIGPRQTWTDRIARIAAFGIDSIADLALQRWFPPHYREANPAVLAGCRAMLTRTPAEGYAAACTAMRDADLTEDTRRLSLPTLCIAGSDDLATPPSQLRTLADIIDGARYHEIAGCGHLPPVQDPEACAHAITAFLASIEEQASYDRGMSVRRRVLGDAHVDRAGAVSTPVDMAFQQLITEGAWGSVWSGRHLTLRERSIVTLALLAAAGQDEEVAMHLRATQNTGASEQDVAEAMLHVAIYAGVPRANTALKIAREVLAPREAE